MQADDADWDETLDQWKAHYGSSPLSWGDDVRMYRYRPSWMVGYAATARRCCASTGHKRNRTRDVSHSCTYLSNVRVLVTGMSGTGKSSVVAELRDRGYVAYDVDDDLSAFDPSDGRWHWRTDEVRRLLAQADENHVFIAGCSEEQVRFAWDVKVLLTVPQEVMLDRLGTRTGNTYGRSPVEQEQVLADLADVEPLLRRSADLIIDTTVPLRSVVDQVLAAADGAKRSSR